MDRDISLNKFISETGFCSRREADKLIETGRVTVNGKVPKLGNRVNYDDIIKIDGSLYSVIEFGQNKTARAAAKVWAKLKGVDNNRSIEKTWNSGDNIYPVRVEKKAYQFLYKDDTGYNFMDNETFEQMALQENLVDAPQFLKEGQEVAILINTETELPMSVELPDKIVLLVTYTEPGLRGDTATRTLKPATVETGANVNVPLFVNEGELIRVNTKTGEYVERVKE